MLLVYFCKEKRGRVAWESGDRIWCPPVLLSPTHSLPSVLSPTHSSCPQLCLCHQLMGLKEASGVILQMPLHSIWHGSAQPSFHTTMTCSPTAQVYTYPLKSPIYFNGIYFQVSVRTVGLSALRN